MAQPQTIDYDALARQNGAISSQPGQIDYDALARQHGAVGSTPSAATASAPTASVSAAPPPGVWDRLRSAFPIVDRMQYGLQTGFASPSTTSTGQALAKPPGNER